MASVSGVVGRPTRPYRCSWPGPDGQPDVVNGLYKCPDGRWRIVSTGQKFTEPDERQAVARFRKWQVENNPMPTVRLSGPFVPDGLPSLAPVETVNGHQFPPGMAAELSDTLDEMRATLVENRATAAELQAVPTVKLASGFDVPAAAFYATVRDLLLKRSEHVATMTGIPEVARLADLPQRTDPHKVALLVKMYEEHSPAAPQSKRATVAALKRLTDHTGAATLADLTTEKLLAFRAAVESDPALASAGSRRQLYSRIRTLLRFPLKLGVSDPGQLRAALDRCAVLWTAEPMPQVDPRPISRADFHKLLTAAGTGPWRAWLLVGLNLCLHMDEVCGLTWNTFDLDAGTHATIRDKTKRQRIPRAATLWTETVEALRAVPRRGPFVFTSAHGTRYNRNSRVTDFKTFRESAGVPDVTWDHLRDGAYTAACRAGNVDNRFARLLAGHKADGLQANYVLCDPDMVRPACDAVRAHYGPFPPSDADR